MPTSGGGDRGGGRESSGHDRRTKRSVTNPLKDNPFAKKDASASALLSQSPVPARLALPRKSATSIIDCGCNLTSRQLAREQSRMLQRGFDGGVDAVISFCTDAEKLTELLELLKGYPGLCYGAFGFHPDNVKRSNEKDLQKRLLELRIAALTPECVAIFCGLDFTRDIASHYPQERLLDAQLRLASELRLPVLLTITGGAPAHDRAIEKLNEWISEFQQTEQRATSSSSESSGKDSTVTEEVPRDSHGRPYIPRAAIFNFEGEAKALKAYLELGCSIVLTGSICDSTESASALKSLLPSIPLSKLLVASNSPHHTPSTIRDEFIRTTRNEPSNLVYILPTIVDALATAIPQSTNGEALKDKYIALQLYCNACNFFGFEDGATVKFSETSDESHLTNQPSEVESDGQIESSDCVKISSSSETVGSKPIDEENITSGLDSSVETKKKDEISQAEVQYTCRSCRRPLFTDQDVMLHDSTGLRASARALAAAALHGGVVAAPQVVIAGIVASSSALNGDREGEDVHGRGGVGGGGGGGGGGGRSGIKGRKQGAAKDSGDEDDVPEPVQSVEIGEVAVGRWREAKGKTVMTLHDQGACRMLLIEQQPWMKSVSASDPEGSLLCPGCSAKIGQYNLSGLKCSCGLTCTPAFKIPRARVDAALLGVDALEAALMAVDVKDRLGGDLDDSNDGLADDDSTRREKERRKKAPISKHKGNFSEFRNKTTITGGAVKRSGGGGSAGGE